jgi:hypothetical protein
MIILARKQNKTKQSNLIWSDLILKDAMRYHWLDLFSSVSFVCVINVCSGEWSVYLIKNTPSSQEQVLSFSSNFRPNFCTWFSWHPKIVIHFPFIGFFTFLLFPRSYPSYLIHKIVLEKLITELNESKCRWMSIYFSTRSS